MPLANIANLFRIYIRSEYTIVFNITRFVWGKQNTIFPSETVICISEASVNWLNMPFNAKTPRKIEFSLMAKKIGYKLWLLFRNVQEIDTKSSGRNNPCLYCLTVRDVSKILSLKGTSFYTWKCSISYNIVWIKYLLFITQEVFCCKRFIWRSLRASSCLKVAFLDIELGFRFFARMSSLGDTW